MVRGRMGRGREEKYGRERHDQVVGGPGDKMLYCLVIFPKKTNKQTNKNICGAGRQNLAISWHRLYVQPVFCSEHESFCEYIPKLRRCMTICRLQVCLCEARSDLFKKLCPSEVTFSSLSANSVSENFFINQCNSLIERRKKDFFLSVSSFQGGLIE